MRRNLLISLSILLLFGGAGMACNSGDAKLEKKRKPAATGPTKMATPMGIAGATAGPQALTAQDLATKYIIVDGHVDLPYRAIEAKNKGEDIGDPSTRLDGGDFDFVRAKQGGLDAPFMSIYIPASYQTKGGATKLADQLIDMVEGYIAAAPDKFAAAHSVADIERNFAEGKVSLPMGIENGAALEGNVANVAHFYKRGVRYITLTHSKDNDICDSSYDESHTHRGLSELGKKIVAEMNRVGIMVDVSHVSDDAFWEVMKIANAPAIASHSSTRQFVPKFERNMSDDMIRKLAEKGGVIMINVGSGVLTAEANAYDHGYYAAMKKFREDNKLGEDDPKVTEFGDKYKADKPYPHADVKDVADHIDHVVKLAGIDHVGLGSDFDGVGPTLPTGLEDVSKYPNLLAELLTRGYSEQDIAKLCGANALRVWKAVEAYAASQAK